MTSLFSQQGFLKVFDNNQQEVAGFLDIVNDNDTLVFYGVTRDSSGVWGTGFYQIDTFGNVLNKNVIIDPDKTLTTSYDSRKKIIKTSDGSYAMIGTTDGGNYFLKVNRNLELLLDEAFDLDVSGFSPGFYSVEVITRDVRYIGKFIKTRE